MEKIHRCGHCKTKQYCSKRCLKQDWRKGHQEACPQLKGDRLREKEDKEERRVKGGEAVEQSMGRGMDVLDSKPGGVEEAKWKQIEDVTQRMKNL